MKATLGTFVVLWLTAEVLCAQTTGTIVGVARDSTGAVVPGVTVEVVSTERGISRAAVTDDQGYYRVVNLAPGAYEVRGTLPGFRTAVRSGVQLTIGQEASVDLALQLGDLSEDVVVTGEAQLVDTTSSTVGGLVGEQTMRDLPLNGRSYDQLITLSPGVLKFTGRGSGIGSMGTGNLFSVSGLRIRSNKFTTDGLETGTSVSLSTTPGGVSGNNLGVEAIREFKVATNSYAAEYGKKSG